MPGKLRDLSELEQEALFLLYARHNGNVSALSRDKETPFKNRKQIVYYRDKYGFKDRLPQFLSETRKKEFDISREWLLDGKKKVVEAAFNLLKGSEVKSLDGKVVGHRSPEAKDVKVAWEIIKVELGEVTSISQNNNRNDSDLEKLDEMREDIKQFFANAKTAIAKAKPGGDSGEPKAT